PASLGDVIELYLVLGEKRSALALLPGLCASQPVYCSDLSVNPVWLPLRGGPYGRAHRLGRVAITIAGPSRGDSWWGWAFLFKARGGAPASANPSLTRSQLQDQGERQWPLSGDPIEGRFRGDPIEVTKVRSWPNCVRCRRSLRR